MNAPKHIAQWWADRLKAMSADQRNAATDGVADFNEHDWRAFHELHETFKINERTKQERAELDIQEQRILRKLPPLQAKDEKGNPCGPKYPAAWTWGVRLLAARNLWGAGVWSRAEVAPLETWES